MSIHDLAMVKASSKLFQLRLHERGWTETFAQTDRDGLRDNKFVQPNRTCARSDGDDQSPHNLHLSTVPGRLRGLGGLLTTYLSWKS